MACRVGITTDPESRKAYWKSVHPSLYGWTILGTYSTRAAAQARENAEAAAGSCAASPGGADAPGPWYVYKFSY